MKDSRTESTQEQLTITQEDVWFHLDQLKHLASVARSLDANGPGEDGAAYGLDWEEYRDKPDKEPQRWLDKELFPFLRVVARRLEESNRVFSRLEQMAAEVGLYADEFRMDEPSATEEGGAA